MDPERWRKIEALYEAALAAEPARRAALLEEGSAGDESLKSEVESLLVHGENAGRFLNVPPREKQPEVGSRVSHYEIQEKIGEGGMGVVYKARDTRLGRSVALKFVKAQFSERFEREARAIAALNHPHIATLHDVGEHEGAPYLAMEFVEGQPLKGPRPVKEVTEYGIQLADALAAAHAAGIVHRDLKPANILVTEKGSVKVLDFGLAKLRARIGDATPAAATLTGISAGTPGYMSPEQIDGKPGDSRSDIFAYGCLLYELASGRHAFEGDSVGKVLAATTTTEPKPLDGVPPELDKLIRRCLRKDPARRYQHMDELKIVLEEFKDEPASGKLPDAAPSGFPRWIAGVLGLMVVVLAVGVTWWLARSPKSGPAPVLTRLTSDSGLTTDPALSADGKLVAYASDRSGEGHLDIWVRQVGGGEPMRLTRGPADNSQPAFSPDGTQIAFRSGEAGGGISVVSTLGGTARRVAPEGQRPQFSPDGNWIAYWAGAMREADENIQDSARIYLVALAGGVPRRLRPDFVTAAYPVWSPDGKGLLFLGNRDKKLPEKDSIDWWVTPLDLGPVIKTGALEATRTAKLEGAFPVHPWMLVAPAWQPDGDSLVFSARSGDSRNLWRIGISVKTWKVTGPPQRLTSGSTLDEMPSVSSGAGRVRVAFASLNENSNIWSLPIKPNEGKVVGDLQQLTRDLSSDFNPVVSPDDSKMLFISARSGHQEIWIKNLRNGEDSMLTATRAIKYAARFSPDGSKVAFTVGPNWDAYIVPTAGGAPELVFEGCGLFYGWSSDGKLAICNNLEYRLNLLDLGSRRKTELFAPTAPQACCGWFSPDDRWITFFSAGHSWMVPFAGKGSIPESAWIDIGVPGVWAPDGKLTYDISNRDGYPCIWAQRLDASTKRRVGEPFAVFHSHSARVSLGGGLHIGHDRMVFTMAERTGNIWMTEICR